MGNIWFADQLMLHKQISNSLMSKDDSELPVSEVWHSTATHEQRWLIVACVWAVTQFCNSYLCFTVGTSIEQRWLRVACVWAMTDFCHSWAKMTQSCLRLSCGTVLQLLSLFHCWNLNWAKMTQSCLCPSYDTVLQFMSKDDSELPVSELWHSSATHEQRWLRVTCVWAVTQFCNS